MLYNYFRDYDSSLGRYSQSDPVGIFGGLATYGYVHNNPLGSIDSRGLYADCKAVWRGPWTEVGHFRRNEKSAELHGGFEFDFGRGDGPQSDPQPRAGGGAGSLKLCPSIRMRLTIWRILLIAEEFDLWGKYAQGVTFRCEETKGCPPVTRVTYNEQQEFDERFLNHISTSRRERDLWKRFDFNAPSPVCTPGVGGPGGPAGAGR